MNLRVERFHNTVCPMILILINDTELVELSYDFLNKCRVFLEGLSVSEEEICDEIVSEVVFYCDRVYKRAYPSKKLDKNLLDKNLLDIELRKMFELFPYQDNKNLRFEKTFSKASFCPILHIFIDDEKVAQFNYEFIDDIYITLKGDYNATLAEMVYACDYEAKRCQPPKKLDKNLLDIELRKIFPQNLQKR